MNYFKDAQNDMVISLKELEDVLPDNRYVQNISDEETGKLISKFLYTQKEDIRNVFIRKYYFFDSVKDIAKRYHFTESKELYRWAFNNFEFKKVADTENKRENEISDV